MMNLIIPFIIGFVTQLTLRIRNFIKGTQDFIVYIQFKGKKRRIHHSKAIVLVPPAILLGHTSIASFFMGIWFEHVIFEQVIF